MTLDKNTKEKHVFKRVAIVGLGLMGASLGLALKQGRIARTVAGFARRAVTRKLALKLGMVDEACDTVAAAVTGAELVVVCAPVGVIPALAEQCRSAMDRNAVLTDVGSVKTFIVAGAERLFSKGGARFVGSHPIAGSEQHGLESARADLYRGAVVVVTPARRASQKAVKTVARFWRALGAEVVLLSPESHDRIVARTSHLPHAVAALLSACVGRERAGKYGKFCGAGFRDTTRVAEGEPALWRDILENNAPFLRKELKAFAREINRLAAVLKKGNGRQIEKYLEAARESRRRLLA
jgi:prephenate dehydrogenase